jgi:hypothetical protein
MYALSITLTFLYYKPNVANLVVVNAIYYIVTTILLSPYIALSSIQGKSLASDFPIVTTVENLLSRDF